MFLLLNVYVYLCLHLIDAWIFPTFCVYWSGGADGVWGGIMSDAKYSDVAVCLFHQIYVPEWKAYTCV